MTKADYTRYNSLKWYKKLYAFFNPVYKRKYIDLVGYEINNIKQKQSE